MRQKGEISGRKKLPPLAANAPAGGVGRRSDMQRPLEDAAAPAASAPGVRARTRDEEAPLRAARAYWHMNPPPAAGADPLVGCPRRVPVDAAISVAALEQDAQELLLGHD